MPALPATGRHREIPACLRRTVTPARPRHRLPAPCSPYAREQATLLDGARSPLARPYLAGPLSSPAAQRRRRRALWLATAVGVDIDHRDIHAVAGGAV
ncbi:hypothetical protein ABZY68_10550 [Streptomyces sp. NPDC006482]|uniref:hypothetical protein n=1 Tax=Streptomyces sp. NPDC006482 TaxID=3154306 RepID=UPI0033A8EC04